MNPLFCLENCEKRGLSSGLAKQCTTSHQQQKPAISLGFRFSFNRQQPPETVGFVTESVTGSAGVAASRPQVTSSADEF